MELDKYIGSALKGVLKNPIVSILKEIGIASILLPHQLTYFIFDVSISFIDKADFSGMDAN